jgi:membrane fusion protein (multidrug efflux system)
MRRYRLLIIILIIIAGLGIYKFYFLNDSNIQKQGGKPPMSILPVTAFLAKSEKTDNKLFITGTAYANEEVNLIPEISGKLTYLNIPEAKVVAKGTLLAKINDVELQAQLKKLKSESSLQQEIAARNKKLLDINSISKEEYETSLNAYNVKQTEIELIRAQILKTEIRAPFSGLLGFKSIGPGSYVSPGQIIANIQQIDPVKIDFSIPEKYKSLLKTGNTIRFTIDGIENAFEAKINIIEPKIDINTRTIKVRALYNNKQQKIFPGAFVKIEMVLKEQESSIMIPSEALIPILKGYKVFVSDNGMAKEVEVETGFRTETEVQIVKGLNPGDTIITSGIMSLKPGSKVNITSIKER